jgi:hypothetical protein
LVKEGRAYDSGTERHCLHVRELVLHLQRVLAFVSPVAFAVAQCVCAGTTRRNTKARRCDFCSGIPSPEIEWQTMVDS